MTSVCLAVMAKNEERVIRRCLASARPLVTSWVVMDTGSTDRTREVARDAMDGLPGEVVDRPWRGFAASRSEVLALARARAEYTLVIDADDALEYPPGARFPELTEPCYALRFLDGPLTYFRVLLFSNAHAWRFEGAIHEYPVADDVDATRPARLDGIVYRRIGGGARSTNPRKYHEDAEVLEAAVRADPTNAREVFYLARSYEDAGELARALANYERRAVMGGWDQEVFYAKLSAARLRQRLGAPIDAVTRAYLEAWGARPTRAEPLCELARVMRLAGDFARAAAFARAALGIPIPEDALFVHADVYLWRALDELAVASLHLGDRATARDAYERLLAASGRHLPPEDRARIDATLAELRA